MADPFTGLDLKQRREAEKLADAFRALGADDPEGWAASEVAEDIPQLARFLLLRRLWRDAGQWTEDPAAWFGPAPDGPVEDDPERPHEPAAQAVQRALSAGVHPDDLKRIVRAVVFDACFSALHVIDEGFDPDEADALPGWVLAEVGPDGNGTGRVVGGLHESLLSMAPPLFPGAAGDGADA